MAGEALHEQRDWLRVTLSSIGDAVVTTDTEGRVTFLNPVAEDLTGWTHDEANGMPLVEVFKIINQDTRKSVESPAARALRDGVIVGLANHTLLISKDGTERPIDDSAAPIRNARNQVAGVVLVFRDITERYQQERTIQDTLDYANNIIATLREPFLVISGDLQVHTANRSFYENFRTTPDQTEGRKIFELGNGQWDIPRLRTVLSEVLSSHHPVTDYEVEHDFPTIGRRSMLLNAILIRKPGNHSKLILLAIEDITDRKEAEAALRESEERYRILFNSMDEGYCIIEMIFDECQRPVDYRFLEVNAAFQKQTGMSDATGKRMREFVPNIEDYWLVNYGKVALTGEPMRFANEYKGLGSWFDVYAFRVGKPGSRRVAVLFNNITERKRAGASARFLASIVDNSDDAIVGKSLEGIIQSWNAGAVRIFGYTSEQAVGRPITLIIPPDRSEEEVRILAHLRAGERVEHFDTVRVRKDGRLVPVALTISPIKDEAGKVIGASKIARDITDRKKAEVAVLDSETRYRRLFESAKDGILILDHENGRVIDANPFMCELLGYSHIQFLGKELWEIGLFGDKSASEAAVRTIQQDGYVRYEHLPLETIQGRRVEVEVVANAYQEDRKPVIQCNIRDITERSQMERKVKEQAEALAELHRRKDEFLAMLGHELRNPLAPISNAVHLLRLQEKEEPLQLQARSIIERQVTQLTRLVDDLLEVSRIATGRVQLRHDRVAMRGIVERALETARPLIDQRRHELTVSVQSEPIWLFADAARLEQVVVNLLTNAAKYTDEGGHIWLTVEQQGDECVVVVRDSGVGIAPEVLPRVFDLFTQAERSLDRSQGGLGIGLSLVQRLVEMHRGRVEVHSSLGHGSEFSVRLPVVVSATPPSPPTAKETSKPTGSLRVLVVDDNVDAATSFADLLTAFRHDTRTVFDGPSALQAAIDYRPDVVLLDIGLPMMDGYEVARRIRQQPSLKNIVLVALTGYGQESDRDRAKEAGFDHHLVKPADFEEVQEILATVSE